MSQALPASPCNEAFVWMRSMSTSSIMRFQSIFSCGMHCRCRRMGFPVPEHLLLISGQTFSSCRAPPPHALPPFRRPKNCCLFLSTTTSLCRRSSWPMPAPFPLALTETTWGARPLPLPANTFVVYLSIECAFLAGIIVIPVLHNICLSFIRFVVAYGLEFYCLTLAKLLSLQVDCAQCAARSLLFIYQALCSLFPVSCA